MHVGVADRSTNSLLPLILVACVLASPLPARASWIFDAEAGIVHETNVGLAQKARDVKSDSRLSTALSTGIALPFDDRSIASVTGDLTGDGHAELSGLSNFGVGATTAFRHKFGLGPAAPWVRVFGSGARLEFEDAVRDGWRYRVGAGAGIRLGGRVDLRVDYAFEEHQADHGRAVSRTLPGNVFDTTSHTYSGRVDFFYSEVLSLFAAYALRDGDVVSTTRRNADIFAASSALTADPAFGRDFIAYKIDAIVHILSFGMSFAIAEKASLNFGYERQIGLGKNGLDYYNDVSRAGVLFSY
jgi:hypothetical protein